MKKLIALTLICIHSVGAFACSTFLLSKKGQLVFGRNYDWVSGNGMVVVNARGINKTSLVAPGEKPVTWVSQCGSITFNQFGKEFPHGGINEKGLVVEQMWLSETRYPAADDRAALNELQWIQYQLDNCTTVEEVIQTNNRIRISRDGAAPIHFLVADATGNAATIEFISGKMVVHRGKDLPNPVLTNTVYQEAYRKMQASNKSSTVDNSLDRFTTACRMVQQFRETDTRENAVTYAFNILDTIAQGSYTKWRIVYDISNRKIYFLTGNTRKELSLNDVDFACSGTTLYLDINHQGAGDSRKAFAPLLFEQNRDVLVRSARESRSQISIPEATIQGATRYFNEVQCAL